MKTVQKWASMLIALRILVSLAFIVILIQNKIGNLWQKFVMINLEVSKVMIIEDLLVLSFSVVCSLR